LTGNKTPVTSRYQQNSLILDGRCLKWEICYAWCVIPFLILMM